jgi:hypothetical protein
MTSTGGPVSSTSRQDNRQVTCTALSTPTPTPVLTALGASGGEGEASVQTTLAGESVLREEGRRGLPVEVGIGRMGETPNRQGAFLLCISPGTLNPAQITPHLCHPSQGNGYITVKWNLLSGCNLYHLIWQPLVAI